ncbi:MAG: Calx-beta domain-containing protein, partial [Cyanobacteria bacterium J06633_2]
EFNTVKTDFKILLEEDPNRPGFFRTTYGNPEEINRENFDEIDASKMYFPINKQELGNEGLPHNYHFTTELKPHKFTYKGDEVFTFIGDDDLWVYIDGKLVIDLGGTHIFQKETLDLSLNGKPFFKKDFFGQTLKLIPGQEYEFVLFHAERHTKRSFFYFETTFELKEPPTVRLLTPVPSTKEPGAPGEQPEPGKFRFVIDEPIDEDLEISFNVTGKAKEGEDYISFNRPVTIPARQKSIDVPVFPLFDEEIEGDEDVVVTLEDTANYQRGMPYIGVVTIKDCPPPCPVVCVEATVPEALEPGFGQQKKNGVFTITLSEPSFKDLVIHYVVEQSSTAEAGVDYKTLSGSVTIPKGKTEREIFVEPIQDDLKEGNETVTIRLKQTDDPTGNCYKLKPDGREQTATVTIIDAPCPIACIIASDPEAIEPGLNSAGENGEFTITLDRPAWKDLTINLKPPGGDAKPGVDYQPLPTQVTIPKGDVEVKIPVIPIEDDQKEGDETVLLALAPGDGYEVCPDPSENRAVVVIIDFCPVPYAGVRAVADAIEPWAGQPGVNGLFRIYLTRPAHKDIVVNYKILDSSSATPGTDYVTLPNSATILKGNDSVDVPVVPKGDLVRESFETVVMQLQPSSPPDPDYELNGQFAPIKATVRIQDKYVPPCVSIVASVNPAIEPGFKKAGKNGEFTIRLDRPFPQPIRIHYRVGGAAIPNTDYVKLGVVVMPANQTVVKLPVVPLKDDETPERNEAVEVTLLAPAGSPYKLHPDSRFHAAAVRIVDCPPIKVEIKAVKPNACEPREAGDEAPRGDWGRFMITLSQPAPARMRVAYGISGSADPGQRKDYLLKDERGRILGAAPRNNKVVFKKNQRKLLIDVVPLGDRDYREGVERVVCTLQDGNGYILTRKKRDNVRIKPFNTDPGLVGGGE